MRDKFDIYLKIISEMSAWLADIMIKISMNNNRARGIPNSVGGTSVFSIEVMIGEKIMSNGKNPMIIVGISASRYPFIQSQ